MFIIYTLLFHAAGDFTLFLGGANLTSTGSKSHPIFSCCGRYYSNEEANLLAFFTPGFLSYCMRGKFLIS
jgi:hypothetical protein